MGAGAMVMSCLHGAPNVGVHPQPEAGAARWWLSGATTGWAARAQWRIEANRLPRGNISLHMAREVVQDCLPACALLLLRVGGFTVKGDLDGYTRVALRELNNPHTIPKYVLKEFMRNYLCVLASKVKTKGAVFGLHSR